jgi:hypothetical protein
MCGIISMFDVKHVGEEAVDDPSLCQQSGQLLDRLAERITRRGWTTPVLLLLGLTRPFSFIASQGLLLFQPLSGLLNIDNTVAGYAELLADRSNVDRLASRLEQQGSSHKEGE